MLRRATELCLGSHDIQCQEGGEREVFSEFKVKVFWCFIVICAHCFLKIVDHKI